MLRQRAVTAVVALGLGLSLGVGVLAVPSEAQAKSRAVEICRAQRETLGEETFTAAYKNFGGCVSAFSANPDSATAPAHACHFLVGRGLFETHGQCVNFFKSLN